MQKDRRSVILFPADDCPAVKCLCLISLFFEIAEDNIISSRPIADHCDRISDLLFFELDVLSAVFREFLVIFNAAYVCLPSRKSLVYRFCLLQKMRNRELCRHFTVDLIFHAHRNLVQISQHIEHRKRNVRSALHPAAVF